MCKINLLLMQEMLYAYKKSSDNIVLHFGSFAVHCYLNFFVQRARDFAYFFLIRRFCLLYLKKILIQV
jgi:hypothetical protein